MEEAQALHSDTIFHKLRLYNREAVHVGTARGRPPKASLRGGHIFVSRVVIKQKKSLQVVTRRSLTQPPGLFLYPAAWIFGIITLKHARANMSDQRPCQRISPLQAPVHTAASQLGSNASACLRRFSPCFTLPGLVKHTRGPPRHLLEPQGRPPICSQDNDVCELGVFLAAGRWWEIGFVGAF